MGVLEILTGVSEVSPLVMVKREIEHERRKTRKEISSGRVKRKNRILML